MPIDFEFFQTISNDSEEFLEAILCSYCWITSTWPYPQGNLELRREKL